MHCQIHLCQSPINKRLKEGGNRILKKMSKMCLMFLTFFLTSKYHNMWPTGTTNNVLVFIHIWRMRYVQLRWSFHIFKRSRYLQRNKNIATLYTNINKHTYTTVPQYGLSIDCLPDIEEIWKYWCSYDTLYSARKWLKYLWEKMILWLRQRSVVLMR